MDEFPEEHAKSKQAVASLKIWGQEWCCCSW